MSVFGQARLRYPPFREAHQGLQMRDSVTLGGRPYHFSQKLTERRHIHHLLGEPLLQLGVLLLKRLQSLRLGDFHAALFGLPVVKRRVENPVLADRSAAFAPTSCSRKTPMICSSVNLCFFIRPS